MVKSLAVFNDVRHSPRKVAVVAGLVRGRTVEDALSILEHVNRDSATVVYKAVKSAAANATNNHRADKKTLFISEISVTPGARIKRFRPAARGRALPFVRKCANVRVVVCGDEKPVPKPKSTDKGAKE